MIVVSTYAEGSPPEDAAWFYKWLEDSVNDFRVPKTLLGNIRYAVFGLGNSLYSENYNVVGRNIDLWLGQLGAERFSPFGLGDENVAESLHGNIEADFDHWCEGVLHLLKDPQDSKPQKSNGCSKGNDCCSKKGKKKFVNQKVKINALEEQDVTRDSDSDSEEPVVDLEDLGSFVRVESKDAAESEEEDDEIIGDGEVREMLTPQLRESLSKQGYRLIGTHSGVKLCRWTKVNSFLPNITNLSSLNYNFCHHLSSRPCCVAGVVVTNIRSMALKVIGAWKQHLVLLVLTNVCSVGVIIRIP